MNETLKILVVDDDEVDRMAVRRALKASGIQIALSEVESCRSAIAMLQQEKFDCAFLDYCLPDGDGLSLVRAIRDADIKVALVVLTGQGDEQIAVELMKAGASDYIGKSRVSPDSLVRSLRNAIRIHRAEIEAAQASQQLKVSEERFRSLVQNSSDLVTILQSDGTISYSSPAVQRILGYESEAIVGTRVFDYVHPEEQLAVETAFGNTLQQPGVAVPMELRLRHADGRWIDLEIVANNLLDEPSVQGIVVNSRNITERKQAEEALRKAYDVLELRVEERTAALSAANASLQEQIIERRRVAAELRNSQEAIHKLYEIVAAPDLDFAGKIQALLAMGCRLFQLDVGILSCISDQQYEVVAVEFSEAAQRQVGQSQLAIAKGDVFDLGQTFCSETLKANEPISVEHIGANNLWRGHPCYIVTQIEAYIATPITVAGKMYGTLNFSSSTPRQTPFQAADKKFLQLMAQWIGGEIARSQSEASLRQSEERYRSVIAAMQEGIVLQDAEGVIQACNASAERIFGLPSDQILGKSSCDPSWRTVYEDGSPFPHEKHPAIISLCTGQPSSDVVMGVCKPDGTLTWISVNSQPLFLDTQSKPYAVVVSFADITKRKQAEEQIRTLNAELEQRVIERTAQLEVANQLKDQLLLREQTARAEAEAANRMKDEFLATLSHELRTPLNAMLGWARLLRTRRFDESTTARAIETIERNATSQAQLIEDLLDVSRIITGKLRLNTCLLELIPVIRAAIDTVRPAAEAKAIRLSANLDTAVGPVTADPDRLQQIIWNLLSNAIKFTPEGGSVEISLAHDPSHVQIQVRDTGQGIHPNFLPYVFDRFRQADGSFTRSHGGLGLGLAIVRHLVELHGGTAQAYSDGEGKGATFKVSLPLHMAHTDEMTFPTLERAAETNDSSVRFEKSPSLRGLQILVVDDEADTRDFLKTVLEQSGATVITAASASGAIAHLVDHLNEGWPDVLVSDIGMPGEDGYSLINKVRILEAEHGKWAPAIALTAYARVEDRMRALLASFQLHVPKPADPTELIVAIANLTQRIKQV